ncbi:MULTISPECIES: GNAT family N-acetyltransferase [Burkholderia cepacia complex]|uniref:GNAT family N-acetyltransferase n=1 Tax=Burkholderia cepacia complex TaxID=87882 RepID=UPI000F08C741|nr:MULTISPECIES: GNAT family N-acetyltransferase [Burkholderia cepacia complex]AYQ40821.1 N-acetyltransferase [Burkholderia lata]
MTLSSHLTTPRLIIRRLASQDIDLFLTMESDPEVMRFTTGVIEATPERRAELLAAVGVQRTDGLGHWCVEKDSAAIGWISLTSLENTGRIELAYRFTRTAWGHGYATEAGQAMAEYSESVLQLSECVAVVWPGNEASKRVLFKLQFCYEGLSHHYGRDVEVFCRSIVRQTPSAIP